MVSAHRWQQTALFEPANTGQMIQEHYTGLPGGYSSFYFNTVPTDATLAGIGVDKWQVASVVGILAVAALGGFVAWRQRDMLAAWRKARK